MEAKIRGLDKLNAAVRLMVAKAENAEPLMKAIGIMQIRSIQKNFDAGGRPERWKMSLRAQYGGKEGSKKGKTLIDKGILKNSITSEPSAKGLKIGPSGPAAVYAAAQHFGYNFPDRYPKRAKALRFFNFRTGKVIFAKKVRGFRLPARPFLVFQKEDIDRAKRATLDWISGAVK